MERPYFSIIIPFYNKERTIKACLESLDAQDFPKDNYEIITVNNNSTDGSISIIEQYPSIKLIHENQQGVYIARNTGIREARGVFAVFTDADVEVTHDWLSNIYSLIKRYDYDIIIGWFFPARPIKLLQIHSLLVSQRIKKALQEKSPSMLTACAANLIIKKETLEKEGLFRTDSNSEDMYFTIRCLEKGYKIGFSEDIRIKRNDIDSISIFLLKNFIYGCSNTRDILHKLSILGKLRYAAITIKIAFKYFPLGLGLLLFTFSYFSGYLLSKSRLLKPGELPRLVYRYTRFINKMGV
jgi:glycosyltransferase involved in cell wall biosynthesis